MYNYIRKGTGEPFVLVHGFLSSLEIFHTMIDDLAQHFDVVAVDLPGHGESNAEKATYTVETYAQGVAEVLDNENIQNAIWLGHSLGGYIVLAALAENIAQISKVILLHSAVNADDDAAKDKRTLQQKEIEEDGVLAIVDKIIPNFFASSSSPEIIEKAKEIANKATVKGPILALEAMKNRPDRQSLIDETSIPVLIIEGSEDKIVTPIQTNNPNVKKVQVNSGHLGMLEDLDSVLTAIYEFLK